MIISDNLKFCFDNLSKKEIEEAMDSNKDYILFELHTFNVGGFATIKVHDYDEEIEKGATDNGQVFCDKEAFLTLFEESESTNEHLKEYL